jgi:undecaprenyl-diphosphatase
MSLDESTNILMSGIENSPTTFISKIIDKILDPATLVIVSILMAGFLFYKGKKKQSIFFVGVMAAASVLIKGLKFVIGRARPANALILETSASMPSGHATIAVVFFGSLTFLLFRELKFKKDFKSKRPFIIIPTILLILISGFTRIYLRVHWLTDVLAGFALGSIILFSGIIIYKKL